MTLEKVKQGDVACSSKGWPDCHCHYQEGVTDANDSYSGMGGCLTDYQGDANDFYKSGEGGTHAACQHTVTPTNVF